MYYIYIYICKSWQIYTYTNTNNATCAVLLIDILGPHNNPKDLELAYGNGSKCNIARCKLLRYKFDS